ncbi:hypothetical protein BMF94_4511 [Rhodotorula taiwanensis]|uniref:PX domain-containing protein n=1 Tax=Rhodotorula taiwanensis TaxID=741276 RepID=A0A2S5B7C8_9BASI|nr:hypothetical protein BMF94_4511 [Rhodotorula taiwanensis]
MSVAHTAASTPIQSLSIPSYVHLTTGSDPHVAYNVSVALPTRAYSIQQRYSAFDSLQQDLAKACGSAPPAPFPPKHPSSWFRNPLSAGRHLSDEQLDERRLGLERWLRAILADRDPRWRSSRVFKEFLAAPPESGAAAGGSDSADQSIPDKDFSATAWTAEYTALEDAMRRLRTTLDRRDSQLLANSSAAHSTAKEARTSLVDLVRRSGQLARGLQGLARDGMTEGELQRRSAMIQRLQGEIEELGRKAGSAPKVGSGRRDDTDASAPSAARIALLNGHASKPPARVLGAAATASLETPETRPLDNEGVMQLQQQYMEDQDTKLEALTAALRRQRHLGELINQELALQEEVLDQLEAGTDRVGGKIKEANKQIKRL